MTRFSGWLKELQNFVDGDECGDVMMCDTRGVFQNEKKNRRIQNSSLYIEHKDTELRCLKIFHQKKIT